MAHLAQKALFKLKYVFTHPNTDTKYKTRCFFVRTYVLEHVFKQLFSECDAYAYICHNAEDCELYYYLLLYYPNVHVITAIGKKFEVLAKRYPVNDLVQKTFIEITASKEDAYKYLTHSDVSSKQAGKVQYSDSAIIGENVDVFTKDTQRRTTSAIDILDAINDGASFRDMAERFGNSFVCNYTRFKDYASAMACQENYVSNDELVASVLGYINGTVSAISLLNELADRLAFDYTQKTCHSSNPSGYLESAKEENELYFSMSMLAKNYRDKFVTYRRYADSSMLLSDEARLNDLTLLEEVANNA